MTAEELAAELEDAKAAAEMMEKALQAKEHWAGPTSSHDKKSHWGQCSCGWYSKEVHEDWEKARQQADAHLIEMEKVAR